MSMIEIGTSDFGAYFEDDVERALRKGLKSPWTFRRNVIYKLSDSYPVQFDFLLCCGKHIVNLECKSSLYSIIESVSNDITYKHSGKFDLSSDSRGMLKVNRFDDEHSVSQIIKQNNTLMKLFPGYVVKSYKLWKTKSLYVMWDLPDTALTITNNANVCEFIPHENIGYLIDALNGAVGLYAGELSYTAVNTTKSGDKRIEDCFRFGKDFWELAEMYEMSDKDYKDRLEKAENVNTHKVMTVDSDDLEPIDYLSYGKNNIIQNITYESNEGQLALFPPAVKRQCEVNNRRYR